MAGILVDFADLGTANKTVQKWFEKTYGVNIEGAKGGAGGGGGSSSGGSSGGSSKKNSPMEDLVEFCGKLVQEPEGVTKLEMALKMMKLEKASECPEDKIPDLMAMLSE